MPDPYALILEQHADHVEPVHLGRSAVPVDPDPGGLGQLLLLPPVDRLDRLPESRASTRLHLDESDRAVSLHHQVDVSVSGPEPTLQDAPSRTAQPSLGDALSQLSECLPGR